MVRSARNLGYKPDTRDVVLTTRDVLEGGGEGVGGQYALERGGGGVGWDPPSSQGPPMVPAEGRPKILKLKSCWHRRRRSKILAVSLKHWKGRGGGPGGGTSLLERCTVVLTRPCSQLLYKRVHPGCCGVAQQGAHREQGKRSGPGISRLVSGAAAHHPCSGSGSAPWAPLRSAACSSGHGHGACPAANAPKGYQNLEDIEVPLGMPRGRLTQRGKR